MAMCGMHRQSQDRWGGTGNKRCFCAFLSVLLLLLLPLLAAAGASAHLASSGRDVCAGVDSRWRRRDSGIRLGQGHGSTCRHLPRYGHYRADKNKKEKEEETASPGTSLWSRRGRGWIWHALSGTTATTSVIGDYSSDAVRVSEEVIASRWSAMWAFPLRGGTGTVVRLGHEPRIHDNNQSGGNRRPPYPPAMSRQRQLLLDTTLALRGGGYESGGGSDDGEAKQNVGDGDAQSTTPTSSLLSWESSGSDANHDGYTLLSDNVVFRGWRNVIERQVQYPSGSIVKFHLTCQSGTSNRAVLVFSWDRSSRTCTLIREYMPSRHSMVIGLAAGMVEEDDTLYRAHSRNDQATTSVSGVLSGAELESAVAIASAQRELAEECRMEGGTWYVLTPPQGVVMDKYCTTVLHAFLVVDATPLQEVNSTSISRDDAEEGMTVMSGVSLEQLQQYIQQGQLTVVGTWGALLAMEKLRSLREVA